MSTYAKSIIAALVAAAYAVLLAWQAATGDGYQTLDVLPVAAALGGAVLTYLVPNVPQLPWAKTAVQLVLGIVAALSQLFADGASGVSLAAVLITVVGAVSVYAVPNSPVDQPGQHALDA